MCVCVFSHCKQILSFIPNCRLHTCIFFLNDSPLSSIRFKSHNTWVHPCSRVAEVLWVSDNPACCALVVLGLIIFRGFLSLLPFFSCGILPDFNSTHILFVNSLLLVCLGLENHIMKFLESHQLQVRV